MRKEISPEMYNYNKFPGPEFRRIENKVLTEGIEFELVENFKEAFEATAFNQRFSEILTKFDYIVGDWSNEQLRLRGFYKDSQEVEADLKISRLEDYLLEYCSFGCAYFVLENPAPRRASFDKKSHHRKGEGREEQGGRRKKKNDRNFRTRERKQPDERTKRSKSSPKKQQKKQGKSQDRHFVIRQK